MDFHEKYEPLLNPKIRRKHNVRYIILTGGRGSGKSTAGNHCLHDISFNADHVIIHSRFTMTSAKISVAAELLETIKKRNSYNFFNIKELQVDNKISKAKVIFKGLKTGSLNQTAALKSITNLNIWYLDEGEELHDESVFDDVDESIRRKGYENLIIISLNTYRITKDHFIYKRFFKERNIPDYFNGVVDDTLYIHTTYLDNFNNLDNSFLNIVEKAKKNYSVKERRELLEAVDQNKDLKHELREDGIIYEIKTDEPVFSEKFQFRYLGKFRKRAEGAVFENWGIYKDDPENYDAHYFGGDFGYTNDPTATVKVMVDQANKTVYVRQILYQPGLLNSQIAKAMKPIIEDHSIVFDSAEAKSISEMRFEHGLNVVGAIKGKDSIKVGVNKMKEWLILIHEESGDLIHEFNNYRYVDKEGLTNEFVDEDNHGIDAIRYVFLYYRL